MKESYCCTQNAASTIIKLHNKKLINTSMKKILPCNCRKKYECPLDGKCRAENIVYKCVAWADRYPNEVYLGTAEGVFKLHFYSHQISFDSKGHSRHNTFQICLANKEEVQDNAIAEMVHNQIRIRLSNISKKFQLRLQGKFEVLNCLNLNELLHKRSELISKCRHVNTFLLSNYKSNESNYKFNCSVHNNITWVTGN